MHQIRRTVATFAAGLVVAAALAAPSGVGATSGAVDSLSMILSPRVQSAEVGPPAPPAGETLDLNRFAEHPRVASFLRYFQGPGRTTMTRWLNRGAIYLPMIRARLAAADLPSDLGYVALIESGFRNSAVSRKGAVGMWQFMPATARAYGLRVDGRVDERRDPLKSTDAAVRHLADLKDRFGSIYLAAAAYNAGAGCVTRGLERLRRSEGLALVQSDDAVVDSLDLDAEFFRLSDARLLAPETVDYVPQLIAAALIAKDPTRYALDAQGTRSPAVDSLSLSRLAGSGQGRHARPIHHRIATGPHQVSRPLHVRVRRGDTISEIAERFGCSEREVRRVNALPKSYRLRAGQILRLPAS